MEQRMRTDGRPQMQVRPARGWRGRSLPRPLLVAVGLLVAIAVLWAGCGADDDAPLATSAGSPGVHSSGSRGAPDADSPMPAPAMEPGEAFAESAGPGIDGAGPPSMQIAGRTILRSGSLDLEVEEVDTSYHRVQQIATAAGGFVADSTFTGTDDRHRATLTIRVPAAQFNDVIDQLRELSINVRSVSTSAQDVTEEYTDLQSALRNLRAVEAQYLELLGRANQIGDILQVQERLNGVRSQIDRIEGRIRLLDDLADLATLTVSLRPASDAAVTTEPPSGLGGAVREAWDASLRTLEAIATVGVSVIVFSWWIIPLVALGALFARRWMRQPRTAPAPAAAGVDTPGGSA
jgi:hypothetical protein